MVIDSTGNGSENGNGHGPFEGSEIWSNDEGPIQDVVDRLVLVIVREAVSLRCSEIQVDVGEECCPVHFVRGNEKLERDSLPVRLFGPFKDRVAQMYGKGKEDNQGQGTFSALLKRTETSAKAYGEARVSVTFGSSSLRLTITDFKSMAS